eukprot:CAMPEP_0179225662 /NCGR_PEP_ID=MMETSP0797-20121207/8421_1 /TAXON_ID=47934 /ORGANISM="Dinophysis acuminata, Strain DAEP01" /LENGTH=238 /DNA_ID=CAMNT_0020932681 /DNA_START=27 /DNA_END=743 /DNA_ORIENTATION=-
MSRGMPRTGAPQSQLLVELAAVARILEGCVQGDFACVLDQALLARRCPVQLLDLPHDLHPLQDRAEDDVPAVQVRRRHRGDEELASVRVLARVRHGEEPGPLVLQLEVLVLELLAVDGLAASAVAVGEVPALEHEVLDDAVELRALVAEPLLAGAERPEVLRRLGDLLAVQAHDDAALLHPADRDVEVDLRGDHGALRVLSVFRDGKKRRDGPEGAIAVKGHHVRAAPHKHKTFRKNA